MWRLLLTFYHGQHVHLSISDLPNLVAGSNSIFINVSDTTRHLYIRNRLKGIYSLSGLLGYIIFNIGLNFYRQASDWQNLSDGLFQIMSIRSAGFEIVDLSYIAPALQSVPHAHKVRRSVKLMREACSCLLTKGILYRKQDVNGRQVAGSDHLRSLQCSPQITVS